MALIPSTEARSKFTQAITATFRERPIAPYGLRNLFKEVEKRTKYVSIEVRRGTEKVAVDVARGTEGNRNSFGWSTQKIIEPPYYNEYFDATQLEMYNRLFSDKGVTAEDFSDFINDVTDKMVDIKYKIDRAYEKQCSDIFRTGVITLADGSKIDYKRKTSSILDVSGSNDWNTSGKIPFTDLENAGNFLRKTGKYQGGIHDIIMGAKAFAAFSGNADVQKRAWIRNFFLDDVRSPLKDASGMVYHGYTSYGSYRGDIWTYPEYYEDASGTVTEYLDPYTVYVIPKSPNFVLGFGAVPQLVTDGSRLVTGAYVMYDFPDQRKVSHDFGIKSAGVAIPVAVDQLVTIKVTA